MARLIQRVLCRWMPQQLGCHRNRREERDRALPGVIHGCFFPDGTFWPQGYWDGEGLQTFCARPS